MPHPDVTKELALPDFIAPALTLQQQSWRYIAAKAGGDKPLKLRLDIKPDIEIKLELARVHGNLTHYCEYNLNKVTSAANHLFDCRR
jgi:hypothetical protein